ncbi:DUF4371 domain-containing protein [Citrus sinensis]|nr:DUF4371 domain-containing protein [Citrus sinensis]
MYISMGSYQPKLEEFPPSFDGQQFCQFQYTWYAQFPWLEYSKEIDFTIEGFRSWKRINNRERCSFLHHEGGLNSHHTKAMLKWGGLKNPSQHIDRVMNAQSSQLILQNRLQLQTSIKVQMTIILRYVDCDGFVHERFFEVVNVKETSASTLKKEICNVLTRYNFLVKDLQGQGYDGASNMRGAWNALQAFFRENYPYAYYVHCFAHRLQLTSVKVSKDVKIYGKYALIREVEIIDLIASGDLETGTRANQISSVSRLISMFGVVHEYLEKLICNGSNNDIRGEAKGVYDVMSTCKFVFILHLMNKVLGISDLLCQALQMKSQDILNVIHLISATKSLLQSLMENGWDTFIKSLVPLCESHHIDVPGMNDRHMNGTMLEHYYQIDLFNAVIDFQLMELNNRFIDQMMKLLTLSSALNPVNSFK